MKNNPQPEDAVRSIAANGMPESISSRARRSFAGQITAWTLGWIIAGSASLHAENGWGVASLVAIKPAHPLPDYTKSVAARDTLNRRFGNAFVTGDFNGDGRLDVAADIHGPDPDDRANAVRMYLQNADGAFIQRTEQPLPTTGWSFTYVAGDFNEDFRLDILMDDLGSNDLVLLPGKGDGTFQEPIVLGLGASGLFASGDLNVDAHLDLVAGNLDGTVGVFLGDGRGGFTPKATLDSFVIPYLPPRGEVMIDDVNNDGKPDVTVGSVESTSADIGSLDVFLGNGDGTFPEVVRTEGVAARRGTLSDFNGDGLLDYAGSRTSPSPAVEIWLGSGDGRFVKNRNYALTYANVWMVRAADLNYDEIQDLLVTGDSLLPMNVFLGRGDGTFLPRQTFTPGDGYQINVTAPEILDVNGDGFSDIIGLAQKPAAPLEEAITVALSKGLRHDPKLGLLLNVQGSRGGGFPPMIKVLERTTNLVNWTPLATNAWSSWYFNDTTPGLTHGIYRFRVP